MQAQLPKLRPALVITISVPVEEDDCFSIDHPDEKQHGHKKELAVSMQPLKEALKANANGKAHASTPSHKISDAAARMAAKLRQVYQEHGRPITTAEWSRHGYRPTVTTVLSRHKTWKEAWKSIGVDYQYPTEARDKNQNNPWQKALSYYRKSPRKGNWSFDLIRRFVQTIPELTKDPYFTELERSVLQAIAQGKSFRQIAGEKGADPRSLHSTITNRLRERIQKHHLEAALSSAS